MFLAQENFSMEKYEEVKEIGSGNFGVAHLMRNKKTHELVAVKYLSRGPKVTYSCNLFVCLSVCLSLSLYT